MYDKTKSVEENLVLVNKYVEDNQGPVEPITQDAIYNGTTITQFGVVNGVIKQVLTTTTASTAKITKGMTSASLLFNACALINSIDTSGWDTSDLINMTQMFKQCKILTTLDVSNFNTSNVTIMRSMFASCFALTTLDATNFNTSNVTNMGSMFFDCKVLTTAGALDKWDVSKVTSHSTFNTNSPVQPLPIWVN